MPARSRSLPLKRQVNESTRQGAKPMKIKVMTIHVDDQAKALRFYCEVLGFTKKADFSNHGYRWLTVASPEAPDGPELQLEANTDPAARAYQQARFQKGQPAANFF